MKRKTTDSKNTSEVWNKIFIPKCFGNYSCPHSFNYCPYKRKKKCAEMLEDRSWLTHAYEKKAEHERKAKYFQKRIERLERKGIRKF